MNIVCVRQGEKYGPEYVRMLRAMIERHARRDLIVLGDGQDADVTLEHGYTGWHAKLELFRPDLAEIRPCLYLDLDTYVLGDIWDLAEAQVPELCLLRDFNRPSRGNSGVMMIPRETGEIWAKRRTDVPDGDYLDTHPHSYLQDRFPKRIESYKLHARERPNAPVVCFHGHPRPHEADGWAGEIWSRYTGGEA